MNQQEFLQALESQIAILPETERRKSLDYYAEMIADIMEDGLSEEQAIERLGPMEDISREILAGASMSTLVKARTARKKYSAGEVILIILGAPLWLPLLISVIAVILSVYVVIWAIVACLYAGVVGLGAGFLGALVGAVSALIRGNALQGVFFFGAASLLAGLTLLLLMVSNRIAYVLIRISARWTKKIKLLLIGRRAAQ